MGVAYIVSAYRLPEQLVRLVRRLNHNDATFLVHVDKKVGTDVVNPIVKGLRDLPHVRFLERHVCHWGGFGHVAASLEGLRSLVENGVRYDHAVLLTGQDYPVKSNQFIADTLAKHRGTSFLSHFPLPYEGWQPAGGMDRVDRWHFWARGRHLQLPPEGVQRTLKLRARRLPRGMRPYGGSSYWMLSSEAVSYVNEYVRQNPDYVRFFQRSFIPDELFFQTLLMNSPLADRVIDDDLRFIEWPLGAPSPAVLTTADLPRLRESEALFARKFDVSIDRLVLDLVEQHLLNG